MAGGGRGRRAVVALDRHGPGHGAVPDQALEREQSFCRGTVAQIGVDATRGRRPGAGRSSGGGGKYRFMERHSNNDEVPERATADGRSGIPGQAVIWHKG